MRAAERASRRAAVANGGAVALPQPPRVGRPSVPALAPRALDGLRRLPDSRWLDRLLRGQTWIALIGVALMGIVAMQVSLLKMNAGIGRAVEHTGTLERQNADLRASVSQLSSEERIQVEAVKQGFVMPPAGDVRYVRARGGEDARKAASAMRTPNPPQSGLLQAQAGAAGAAAVATAAPASGVASATGTLPASPGTTVPPAQQQQGASPVQQQQQAAPPAQQQQQAPPPVQQPVAATGATAAPTGAAG
jgi:hypothetical protein